jgi:hypothetical protein
VQLPKTYVDIVDRQHTPCSGNSGPEHVLSTLQAEGVNVGIDQTRQHPTSAEIDVLCRQSWICHGVSDARDLAVAGHDGRIQQRTHGDAIDHICVVEDQRRSALGEGLASRARQVNEDQYCGDAQEEASIPNGITTLLATTGHGGGCSALNVIDKALRP